MKDSPLMAYHTYSLIGPEDTELTTDINTAQQAAYYLALHQQNHPYIHLRIIRDDGLFQTLKTTPAGYVYFEPTEDPTAEPI